MSSRTLSGNGNAKEKLRFSSVAFTEAFFLRASKQGSELALERRHANTTTKI